MDEIIPSATSRYSAKVLKVNGGLSRTRGVQEPQVSDASVLSGVRQAR